MIPMNYKILEISPDGRSGLVLKTIEIIGTIAKFTMLLHLFLRNPKNQSKVTMVLHFANT